MTKDIVIRCPLMTRSSACGGVYSFGGHVCAIRLSIDCVFVSGDSISAMVHYRGESSTFISVVGGASIGVGDGGATNEWLVGIACDEE